MGPCGQTMALDGVHALDTMYAPLAHGLGTTDMGHGATCVAFDEQFDGQQNDGQSYDSRCQKQ